MNGICHKCAHLDVCRYSDWMTKIDKELKEVMRKINHPPWRPVIKTCYYFSPQLDERMKQYGDC
jgi:predicted SprT family Zn-dependent metalloprotease